MTETLAVLQTVAGFGAIIAAIILPIWQVDRSRAIQQQQTADFLTATVDLIQTLAEQTADWRARQDLRAGAPLDGQAKQAWNLHWAETRMAMRSLLDRAPSNAKIVMALTRCVRALDRAENFYMFGDVVSLSTVVADVTVRLEAQKEVLAEIATELNHGRP